MTIVFYLSYRKIWSELKNNYKENLLFKIGLSLFKVLQNRIFTSYNSLIKQE